MFQRFLSDKLNLTLTESQYFETTLREYDVE